MNAVIENIMKRRSTRRYDARQVDDQVLANILEAGQYAPSGGNNQCSHLIVIQKPEILAELKRLVEQEFGRMEIVEGMYKSLIASIRASQKGGYDFTHNAPTLVVLANQKGYGNALADSACVLENMMLAATSLHVGSCWINQLRWLDENPNIRAYLEENCGLDVYETVCGGLSLGYPATEDEMAPLKRTGNRITYVK